MLFVKATKQNRPEIALIESSALHQFNRSITQLVECPRVVHAVDLCGVEKTLHMFAQTEDCGSLLGRITPDAFEDAGSVVQHVRHHMHPRVLPLDKLAVVPNGVDDARCLDVFNLAVF